MACVCVDLSLRTQWYTRRMQAPSLDVGRAIACLRVALKYKWCNHTIAARGRVQAGVCSVEVKADASLHEKGLCDALHPANNTSPA